MNIPFIIKADWVVCSTDRIIRKGQVRVSGGRVNAVGEMLDTLYPLDQVIDKSGCALIPGFVNAHTHIELWKLRGIARGLPFNEWISKVTQEVLNRPVSFFEDSAAAGVEEMVKSGVTSAADYSTFSVSAKQMAGAGVRGIVYKEFFTPDPHKDYSGDFEKLVESLDCMRQDAGQKLRIGVSCHAPYNATSGWVEKVVTRLKNYPRSIHAQESADEMNYIRNARGQLADAHRSRGFDIKPRNMTPIEYLDNLSYWHSGSQAVHLTQASQGDLQMLANRGVSAAFCPVSNACLGVGVPRIALALRMGIPCGIGTDSAVSSERQDMFEEMRFAVLSSRLRHDPITSHQAFAMATKEGARSLGIDAGEISEGAQADIVCIAMPFIDRSEDIVDSLVFQGSSDRIDAVWIEGRQVFAR